MKQILLLAAAVAAANPVAVGAQEAAEPRGVLVDDRIMAEETVFDGDWLAVGGGVSYSTSYDGSDDYVLNPIPVLAGSLGGIGISPRAGGVALNLLDGVDQGKVSFSFGPMARLRSNRSGRIKDPVVRAAGELDKAIEIGPSSGMTVNGVFTAYDRVAVGLDVRWDVAGAHGGMIVDPGISYFTPLSRGAVLGVSGGAVWVDDDYADYYYSVSPAQSAASGLPLFVADSGWHKAGASTALGLDLDGNFANGGFAIGLVGGYTRMLGDAKRTPYTSLRGDADQWFAIGGVGYIF